MVEERRARELVFAGASQLAEMIPDVVGVYLNGSLAMGDFRPANSDIDLLVVTGAAPNAIHLATMTTVLRRLARSTGHVIDLHVVLADVAAKPAPEPRRELYARLAPGRPVELRADVSSHPELLVELAMARAHGIPLLGPAVEKIIGPISTAWLVDVGDRQVAVWQGLTDDDAHAELMVLTTCRVWHLATEGRFCSKAEAGRWALERDVTLRAVEGALFRRDGDAASAIEPTEIARLLGLVRAEIAATR